MKKAEEVDFGNLLIHSNLICLATDSYMNSLEVEILL